LKACQSKTNMKLWKVRDPSIFILLGSVLSPPIQTKRNLVTLQTRPESVPDVREGCPSDTWDCPPDNVAESPETGRVTRPGVRSCPGRCGHLGPDWTEGSDTGHSNCGVCVCCFVLCPNIGESMYVPGVSSGLTSALVAVQRQLPYVRPGLAWQTTSRCTDVRSRSVQTSGDIVRLAIVLSVVPSLESARFRKGTLLDAVRLICAAQPGFSASSTTYIS